MTEHVPVVASARPKGRPVRRKRKPRHRYFAFLSYSHKDEELAEWLHRALEDFRVPSALVGKISEHGVVPRRLTPVFRDEHELAAADDLSDEIEEALSGSQFLIVLCSPNAAASHWTNAEITTFKRRRPDGCILAAIGEGEPFASDMKGREEEECFPPALRQRYDRLGRPTGKKAEPLAADLRGDHDARRLGFLKLVAGMLGVGLDDLVQRETLRRNKRMAWLVAASLGGMALTSTLAFTAIQARDAARDQRREAEGLVAFMLGDLKDKLEPIGRLDALDGVGDRVLRYYRAQATEDLSDDALLQRSKALSLSAQVAYLRGNLGTAAQLYKEAIDGTEEAARRRPDDAERLYDSAQNYFYLGEIARQNGQLADAEKYYRQYQRLAGDMVRLGPDNMRWRMETQYADANVGIALFLQRRYPEAATQFGRALATITALSNADPNNEDYQKSVADALAWVADAQAAQGNLGTAIATRRRQLALLGNAAAAHAGDVDYADRLVPARTSLALLLASNGDLAGAEAVIGQGLATANSLVASERANTRWAGSLALAQIAKAKIDLTAGNVPAALAGADAAERTVAGVPEQTRAGAFWRALDRDTSLLKGEILLRKGDGTGASAAGARALRLARAIHGTDPAGERIATAEALRLVGDARLLNGDQSGAKLAWREAAALLPRDIVMRPREIGTAMFIARRAGDMAWSKALGDKLKSMNYRQLAA